MDDRERIEKINHWLEKRRGRSLDSVFDGIFVGGALDDVFVNGSKKIFLDTLRFAIVYDASRDRHPQIGLNSDMFYRLFDGVGSEFIHYDGRDLLNYVKLFRGSVRDYFFRAIDGCGFYQSELLNQHGELFLPFKIVHTR